MIDFEVESLPGGSIRATFQASRDREDGTAWPFKDAIVLPASIWEAMPEDEREALAQRRLENAFQSATNPPESVYSAPDPDDGG